MRKGIIITVLVHSVGINELNVLNSIEIKQTQSY